MSTNKEEISEDTLNKSTSEQESEAELAANSVELDTRSTNKENISDYTLNKSSSSRNEGTTLEANLVVSNITNNTTENTSSRKDTEYTVIEVPRNIKTPAIRRNLALPVTTHYIRPLDTSTYTNQTTHILIPGISLENNRAEMLSDIPRIAEEKTQTRPVVVTSETVSRRSSIALSSDQTKDIMSSRGNKYKETTRRVIDVPISTKNVKEYVEENVLEYLLKLSKGDNKSRSTSPVRRKTKQVY